MSVSELLSELKRADPMADTNIESVSISPSLFHGVTLVVSDAVRQANRELRDVSAACATERQTLEQLRAQSSKYREILRRIKALVRSRKLPTWPANERSAA